MCKNNILNGDHIHNKIYILHKIYTSHMVMRRIQVTIPDEELKKLEAISKKEARSMSNMITWLIKSYRD